MGRCRYSINVFATRRMRSTRNATRRPAWRACRAAMVPPAQPLLAAVRGAEAAHQPAPVAATPEVAAAVAAPRAVVLRKAVPAVGRAAGPAPAAAGRPLRRAMWAVAATTTLSRASWAQRR